MSVYAQFDELLFEIILFNGLVYFVHLFKLHLRAFNSN